ncbi:MAG: hypothetical protein QM831_31755 [Kofleriaceae bacterium]
MQFRTWAIATLLAGCGSSSNNPLPDSATAPADAPIDAPNATPWTAPTGALLDGVTLADGWTDLRVASPALVIDGGWTDSLFATPDGKSLLIAYSQVDFSTFFISSGASAPLTGPMLAGTQPTTFKIFEADLGASDWAISAHPIDAFVGTTTVASPATNESGDLMIFSEFDSSGHSQLFYSQKASGAWSAPAAAFTSACNDDNAKIVGELASSVTIYFESNRGSDDGTNTTCGQRTLYTTTYSAATGMFSPVAKVPGIAIAGSDDTQPFLTHDGTTLIWSGVRGTYAVYSATKSGATFGNIHAIATPTATAPVVGKVVLLGEPSIVTVPEGELLYMMCGVASNVGNAMTYHDADHIQLVPCVARRPA